VEGGLGDAGEVAVNKKEKDKISDGGEGVVDNGEEGVVNITKQRGVKKKLTGLEKRGHDDVAKKIAAQGMEWAGKVLRKEDLLVYMYRLVLEYARICDERRDMMGFVDDLVGSGVR